MMTVEHREVKKGGSYIVVTHKTIVSAMVFTVQCSYDSLPHLKVWHNVPLRRRATRSGSEWWLCEKCSFTGDWVFLSVTFLREFILEHRVVSTRHYYQPLRVYPGNTWSLSMGKDSRHVDHCAYPHWVHLTFGAAVKQILPSSFWLIKAMSQNDKYMETHHEEERERQEKKGWKNLLWENKSSSKLLSRVYHWYVFLRSVFPAELVGSSDRMIWSHLCWDGSRVADKVWQNIPFTQH